MAQVQFKEDNMIYLCVTQKTNTFGTKVDLSNGIINVSCNKKSGMAFDIPKKSINKLYKNISILFGSEFIFDNALALSKTKWLKSSSNTIDIYNCGNDFILLFNTVDEYHLFYKNVISTNFGRVQQNNVSSTYSNYILNVHGSGELMFSVVGLRALGCKVTFTDKGGNVSEVPSFNSDIHSHLFNISNTKYLMNMEFENNTGIQDFFESNGYVLTVNQDNLPGCGILTIENMISEDFITNVPPKMNEKILVIY